MGKQKALSWDLKWVTHDPVIKERYYTLSVHVGQSGKPALIWGLAWRKIIREPPWEQCLSEKGGKGRKQNLGSKMLGYDVVTRRVLVNHMGSSESRMMLLGVSEFRWGGLTLTSPCMIWGKVALLSEAALEKLITERWMEDPPAGAICYS